MRAKVPLMEATNCRGRRIVGLFRSVFRTIDNVTVHDYTVLSYTLKNGENVCTSVSSGYKTEMEAISGFFNLVGCEPEPHRLTITKLPACADQVATLED